MPRIDEFGSERSNNGASAANAERVQRDNATTPQPSAPPRTGQATNTSTKRNDVQQYGAQRREQVERELARHERRDADVITTGTTRGARAGRASTKNVCAIQGACALTRDAATFRRRARATLWTRTALCILRSGLRCARRAPPELLFEKTKSFFNLLPMPVARFDFS